MADDPQDAPQDVRPASRKGKAKARPDIIENVPSGEASSTRPQDGKEKKKPRKLERRSVVLQEPIVTLDTRVERLERQFASLSSRVDAVEVRQVRRPTAATYRRSSSTSTRATSSARARTRGSTARHTGTHAPRPSLADQLRESQRLRRTHQRQKSNDNSIEEIPRSALTTTQSQQVALTGQYNIPLPSTLSTEDILNIKSGLTAAGSIARSLATALTASSTREAGNSGTAEAARGTAGVPRSGANMHARSGGKHDSTADPQEQQDRIHQQGDDNKENVFGVGEGNATSSAAGGASAGNAQPEGLHDELMREGNASKTWRNLIWQAGGVVASAAKDAAVEFSSQNPQPADTASFNFGHPETASSVRVGSVRSSSTKSRRMRPASRGAVSEAGDAASVTSASRRRPKASRTSSRASSRV